MNDFTKEELQWLYDTVEWVCTDFSEADSTYVIKDKLKSMIDNYCEHSTYRDFLSGAGSKECLDCGKVW